MKSSAPNNPKKISLVLSLFFFLNTNAQYVSTFSGSGTNGFSDGKGSAVQFSVPCGVALDAVGNVYVADTYNHRIRKITPEGVVTTLAGSGIAGFADGTGTAAQFDRPFSVAIDAVGNIFVADQDNHRIRKITAEGVVSTFAGSGTQGSANGIGIEAQFYHPAGLAIDAGGNIFIADSSNHRIRKITVSGVVSNFAGSTYGFADGMGSDALFGSPYGLALDAVGNVYVADYLNNRIRKITAAGMVSTLAGSTYGFSDGNGSIAQFSGPEGVAVDAVGNVYVADTYNHLIRKITDTGAVTTLAGSTYGFSDGIGTAAKFYFPYAVTVDTAGNLFVADAYNNRIRKITVALGVVNYYQKEVSVFPNPASSIINIKLEDITTAKATIFDMNGRAVQTKSSIDNRSIIDISNLANGIYLMEITTDKGIVSKKIVKS